MPAGDYVFEVKSVYPDGTDSVVNTLACVFFLTGARLSGFACVCFFLVILLITGYAVFTVFVNSEGAKRELL